MGSPLEGSEQRTAMILDLNKLNLAALWIADYREARAVSKFKTLVR